MLTVVILLAYRCESEGWCRFRQVY